MLISSRQQGIPSFFCLYKTREVFDVAEHHTFQKSLADLPHIAD